MITKWTTLETLVTPHLLRAWANRLDSDMKAAALGTEVPFIEVKDYKSNSIILLRANQGAWHDRNKGTFSPWE